MGPMTGSDIEVEKVSVLVHRSTHILGSAASSLGCMNIKNTINMGDKMCHFVYTIYIRSRCCGQYIKNERRKDMAENFGELFDPFEMKMDKKEKSAAGKITQKVESDDAIVQEKKKRDRRAGRNKKIPDSARSVSLDSSFPYMELYRDAEDFDENSFVLEGKIDRIFRPDNKKVMFLNIEVKNPISGKMNYPQVCIFSRNMHIADDVKLGDYVRVYGAISSTVRNTETAHYTKSNYYVYKLVKTEPPKPVAEDSLLSGYGLEGTNRERKTNSVLVTGVVEDIRIKNNCIQFLLRSRFDEKGDTIKIVYYTDNKGTALDVIETGKRIAVVGYFQTAANVGRDGKTIYIQQITARKVNSMGLD